MLVNAKKVLKSTKLNVTLKVLYRAPQKIRKQRDISNYELHYFFDLFMC